MENKGRMVRSEEAAKILGISVWTLRNKCCKKEIPYYKVDRLLYFDTAELDEWLRQCRVETDANLMKKIYNS